MKCTLEKLRGESCGWLVRIVLFLAVSLNGHLGAAEKGENADLVVQKLQARYDSTRDFVADFRQETHIKSLDRRTQGEGKVYFKRPGKMLWQYEEPKGSWVLADGENFYYYQPEQGQILKTPLRSAWNSEVPFSFLLGLGNLKRDFNATVQGATEEEYRLRLVPKAGEGNIGQLFLGIDAASFDIRWVQVVDPVENVTTIRLSDLQRDGGLKESIFRVKIPKGTEVVELGS